MPHGVAAIHSVQAGHTEIQLPNIAHQYVSQRYQQYDLVREDVAPVRPRLVGIAHGAIEPARSSPAYAVPTRPPYSRHILPAYVQSAAARSEEHTSELQSL